MSQFDTGYFEVASSSASDEWATDPEVFASINEEFGPFTLDVCASDDNHKCPAYFTVDDDGLSQPWTGRVWMNPPYGRRIGEWMRKASEAGRNGAVVACLVPARVDTRWWREACEAASLVRIYPGRLKFGRLLHPAPFPSALIVFGPLPGRHGTSPARCANADCGRWWFPARSDARTCSPKCRQAKARTSRINGSNRDGGKP